MATKGRPDKLDLDRQKVLLTAVRAGLPLKHAAKLAGIGRSTLFKWLAKGRSESRGPRRDLVDALKKAETELMREALDSIRKIAKTAKQWTAWAWLLERRWPDDFGQQRHEISELKKQLKEVEAVIRGPGSTPPSSNPPSPGSGAG
ncbi:hypothetical protein BH11PLA2_BH11PLA2_32730 [soil metagenome]